MNYKLFRLWFALLSVLVGCESMLVAARPNVLFIMIDDLGWMDLACQGNKLVETPNIDRLATQGVRFTDAYAAAPVCSPTRAAIMSGLSPARLRITNHLPDQKRFVPDNAKLLPAAMSDHLPLETVTIAERLKQSGYTTGFFGKWHLTTDKKPEFFPEHQGFDINIGGCSYGGPPTFFDPYRIPTIKDRNPGEYLPDRLADEVIQYIQQERNEPFAAFLWNYTVHWPMEAPEPLLKKYEDRKGPGLNDTRYGAMIEAMDSAIGRILSELDRLKMTEETMVIFTSDNGGFSGVSDNRPLRESKGYLYEGGIRIPLIVRWPGKTNPNTLCSVPTISTDWYPTLLAACELPGVEVVDRELEGASIVPLLSGKQKTLDRESLFFHYPNYAWHRSNRLGSAIRHGDYKLIENFDDGSTELYNLRSDLSETKDISEQEPETSAKLLGLLRQWQKRTNAAMPASAL